MGQASEKKTSKASTGRGWEVVPLKLWSREEEGEACMQARGVRRAVVGHSVHTDRLADSSGRALHSSGREGQ